MKYWVAAALLSLLSAAAFAQVESRVDRDDIALGESFTLTITQPIAGASGQFNLNVRRPSHKPLQQDFNVLGINNSSRVVANGNQSSGKMEWIFTLQAKNSGPATIPSLAVGQQTSPPISLNIRPARGYKVMPGQQVFARIELSEETPYVQQQTVYTAKVFVNGQLGMSDYSMGQPSGPFALQALSDDARYRSEIGGQVYDVVERRWALFAQQSGELTITAPEFIAEFGGPSFFSRRSQQQLNIKERTITVQPQPAGFSGALWLPAKAVQLEANLSPPADTKAGYQTGEPITYTLSLTARSLTAAQLPEPPAPSLENARVYPEDPIENQGAEQGDILGQRQRRIAIVPNVGGKLRLPSVEVPWWNTQTNQQEVARLKPFDIDIAAATAPIANSEPLAATPSTASASITENPRHWMEHKAWFFSTLALLLAGLFILIGRFVKTRRDLEQQWLNRDNSEEHKTMSLSARWHAVRGALQGTGLSGRSDSAAAANALANWSRAKWPEANSHSAVAVAERLDPQRKQPELHRELGFLDQCQYGVATGDARWHGERAWRELETATLKQPLGQQQNKAALPELYA